MAKKRIYRVAFLNQGKVYEIYAREISQGGLYGFVEVEGLLFGETSSVVVDASEERLKTEFEGVRKIFLPLHSVLRIDEVEKEGHARITSASESGNVTPFPLPPLSGPGKD
jgi:hypothetical protein